MAFSHFESPEMFGCMAWRRWIHITPAGDVLPCSYTPLTFGSVRREPLKNIWQKIRKHPEYKKELVPCMVQNKEFRQKYIYTIPPNAKLPYPIV
jgi:MoaA/NifB/PqqE/SkfB family radical SAM enzyme